jgi:hypothetical protein
MQPLQGFWDTTMGMTLALWLCTLPFVVVIAMWLGGSWAALLSACVLLVVMLAICRAICWVRVPDGTQKPSNHEQPRV